MNRYLVIYEMDDGPAAAAAFAESAGPAGSR
jgi:hypothetical protein